MFAQLDEVGPVGAVAVQEDDELLGVSALGVEAGSRDFCGHVLSYRVGAAFAKPGSSTPARLFAAA